MRFRGNGRKVARRRCADRETVISFRSVLAPLGPGQNRVGDTHSLVLSCLARRHRLAKSDDDDAAARTSPRIYPDTWRGLGDRYM